MSQIVHFLQTSFRCASLPEGVERTNLRISNPRLDPKLSIKALTNSIALAAPSSRSDLNHPWEFQAKRSFLSASSKMNSGVLTGTIRFDGFKTLPEEVRTSVL